MGVAVASELHSCAGRPLSSSGDASAQGHLQVSDEEAATDAFIPAEGVSAVLVSPRRVLVTGGVLADDRVLPFTVMRFLTLDTGPLAAHAWTKPLLLRRKRRRPPAPDAAAFPVCRIEHTITLAPDAAAPMLYLVGGMKVGGRDEGSVCKTMFVFNVAHRAWASVDTDHPAGPAKPDRDHALGPRFAHSAVFVPALRSDSRAKARKAAGYILVYGGYPSTDAHSPTSTVHLFDIRHRRWGLIAPRPDAATPPHRAYHAAAVSASHRYLIVHGGACSDFWDPNMLSSDLFVFDIDTAAWHRPALLSSSGDPPTARKQHSIVNGIGRHEGSLILFGGRLVTGSFSNELFVLRIFEPSAPGKNVSAAWEKFDVMGPERPLLTEHDNAFSVEDDEENLEPKAHTAVAGGSMLAVPSLNKYLFIGGRGSNGMRAVPLLLDPTEAENLENFERLARLPSRAQPAPAPLGPAAAVVDAGAPDAKPAVGQIARKTARRRSPSPDGKTSLRSDDCVKIPAPNKRPRTSSRSNSDMQATERERLSQNSPAQDILQPAISPHKPPLAQKRGKDDDAEAGIRPGTSVHQSSALPIAEEDAPVEDSDSVLDFTADNVDEDAGVALVGADDTKDSHDHETPPSKRRRFINGTRRRARPNAGGGEGAIITDSDDDIPGSFGSGFIAASDLARKGRSRTGNKTRGQGRGRGNIQGRGRPRTITAAAARDVQKRLEAEEVSNRENTRLLDDLRSELDRERKEKESINRDNRKLNEQIKTLLVEVHSLRSSKKRQPNLSDGSGDFLGRKASESSTPPGTAAAVTEQTLARDRRLSVGTAEEIRGLTFKISDLKEECQEIGAEKDALNKSLRDVEDGKRRLETEMNILKNELDRTEKEKDKLRRQANDLRAAATTAKITVEDANKQLRKEEETNAALKRAMENVKQELRDEQARRVEVDLQASSVHRQLTATRAQLNEAQKKYSEFGSKQRLLQAEVGSRQGKVDELQKLLEETNTAKRKLEDGNITLATELDGLRKDLGKRAKEVETFARDAERSRSAFDSQKKSYTDLDLEASRLRRDLERERRKCKSLTGFVKRREQTLQGVKRAYAIMTGELEAAANFPEGDLGHLLAEAEADLDDEPSPLQPELPVPVVSRGGKGQESTREKNAQLANGRETSRDKPDRPAAETKLAEGDAAFPDILDSEDVDEP